jgi:hypothetical protein
MKRAVFWVVALYRLVWVYQHFRGLYCLHHQDDEGSHHPDDGGSTDLWNFGRLLPVYMALQPRRQPSSQILSMKFQTRNLVLICCAVSIRKVHPHLDMKFKILLQHCINIVSRQVSFFIQNVLQLNNDCFRYCFKTVQKHDLVVSCFLFRVENKIRNF